MAESLNLLTPYFPVYASPEGSTSPDILDPSISAILGGNNPVLKTGEEWPCCESCDAHLIPYIQINASSLQTPEDFRTKLAAEPQPGKTAIFQVFICADDAENTECFGETLVGAYSGAWLIRVLHASSADVVAVEEMRDEMDSDKFFIKERIITHWTAGRPEVEDEEVNWDVDEELYDQHRPAWGLKLLGWPTRGKFYTSSVDKCPAVDEIESENCDWRCLIQLGTHEPYDPEAGETALLSVHTVGNTYVDQCAKHPEVFSMTISGNW